MSKFSNTLLTLVLLALLTGCQAVLDSIPKPGPVAQQPQRQPVSPQPQQQPQQTVQPQVEAVDFNQLSYEEAIAALKAGNTYLAIELLEKVSREAPWKQYVFTNLGLAFFKLEKFDLAEESFKQAVTQNSRDAVAHNHLGILQRRKGQFEDARKRYQQAIDIDQEYAPAHLNLGILFDMYLQDLEKALQQYEIYQSLTREQDSQVAGWIVDIQRRIKSSSTKSQG
jgi:tetratricopeptide (TPR) repeat protein